MSSLLLVRPYPVLNLAVSDGQASVFNLGTPNPKEVYLAAGPGDLNFAWNTGSVAPLDTVYFGYTNLPDGAVVLAYTSTAADRSDSTLLASVTIASGATPGFSPRPQHALMFGALRNARYIDLFVRNNAGTRLIAGVAAAGRSIQPTWGHEWGSGRRVIDTGSKDRLLSGAFGVNPGVRVGSWSWSMGDLTDAEVQRIYDMQLGLGETNSLLAVENPDPLVPGINERIHWGMFAGLTKYERLQPGLTRWELTIEDWA